MLKLNEMSDVKQIHDQKSRYHSFLNCALLHVENQIGELFRSGDIANGGEVIVHAELSIYSVAIICSSYFFGPLVMRFSCS